MSIHYKFRSSIERKTLQLDALSIRADDLVTRICKFEKIREDLFTLLLSNEYTAEKYIDDMPIARNSSIIVQRAPRDNSVKVQKVQNGVNSGMISDESTSSLSPSQSPPIDFENMDEDERLTYIKEISTKAYDPSNYKKITKTSKTSLPPLTYICNRCYQPGHWIKDCPLAHTKRTTGIPMAELIETTADDPQAMLHSSGKFVVRKMHQIARQTKTKKSEDGSSSPGSDIQPPSCLICPLCDNLIKEAVITSCCGNSYCDACINEKLLQIDQDDIKCPGTGCQNKSLTLKSVVPNKNIRQNVEQWLMGESIIDDVPTKKPELIRIAIQPSPPSQPEQVVTPPAISPVPVQFDPTQPPPSFGNYQQNQQIATVYNQVPLMAIQPIYYSQYQQILPQQFNWDEYLRNKSRSSASSSSSSSSTTSRHRDHHDRRDRKRRDEERQRHSYKSSRSSRSSHHKSSRDEPYRRREYRHKRSERRSDYAESEEERRMDAY